MPAFVCLCVRACSNHEIVPVINHHPFKLGSPNLDQTCKTTWLRSLLSYCIIDLDLQGQNELLNQNLVHFELIHVITHHQFKSQFSSLEQNASYHCSDPYQFWAWLKLILSIFNFEPRPNWALYVHHLHYLVRPAKFESLENWKNSEGVNQFKQQPLEQFLGIDCFTVWMFHGEIILSVPLEEDLLGWGCDGVGGLAYLFFVLHTDLGSGGYFGV